MQRRILFSVGLMDGLVDVDIDYAEVAKKSFQ